MSENIILIGGLKQKRSEVAGRMVDLRRELDRLQGDLAAFVFLAFVLLPALTGISNYEAAQYKAAQNAPPISNADAAAWAVADYTKVLAWFTAVLAVVSAFQLWFLRRADETARISADAARAAADAASKQASASLGVELPLVSEKAHAVFAGVPAGTFRAACDPAKWSASSNGDGCGNRDGLWPEVSSTKNDSDGE